MPIKISLKLDVPAYKQIIGQVCALIDEGAMEPDSALPDNV